MKKLENTPTNYMDRKCQNYQKERVNFFFLIFNSKHGLLGEAAPGLVGKEPKNVEGTRNYRHDLAIKGGVQVKSEVK